MKTQNHTPVKCNSPTRLVTKPLALAVLSLVISAAPAFAQSIEGGSVGSGNDGLFGNDKIECRDCPSKPVPAISFETLTRVFETKGTMTDLSKLKGKWKAIIKRKRHEYYATNFSDGQDSRGITNSDGSYEFELFFENGNDDFAGGISTSVEIMGFGDKHTNQGPYEVTLVNNKACYAQNAYPSDGAYYKWECRFINQTHSKLLCAIVPTGNFKSPRQAPWVNQIVAYVGYVRE